MPPESGAAEKEPLETLLEKLADMRSYFSYEECAILDEIISREAQKIARFQPDPAPGPSPTPSPTPTPM